jgi:hypothetical protein
MLAMLGKIFNKIGHEANTVKSDVLVGQSEFDAYFADRLESKQLTKQLNVCD